MNELNKCVLNEPDNANLNYHSALQIMPLQYRVSVVDISWASGMHILCIKLLCTILFPSSNWLQLQTLNLELKFLKELG